MARTLKVLIVDDSEDDALLTLRELRQGGYNPTWKRVDTAESMASALEKDQWDLVISDHQMPHFDSLGALETLNKTGRDIPFIIVSGMIGEDTAVLAMRAGAADYLRKDNLKRLVPVVERELEDAEVRREKGIAENRLQKSEARYRMLFERMLDAFALLEYTGDADGPPVDFVFLDLNDSYAAGLGLERRSIVGKKIREVYPLAGEALLERYAAIARTGVPEHFEYYSESARRHFEISAYSPRTGLVATIIRDITIRKNAAERQDLMSYILETINRETNTQSIIHDIISVLKLHFGFDAVGLRLQKNGDYPYYLYEGFTGKFVETENSLCAKNDAGEIIINDDGSVVLECFCGLVLAGGMDSKAPYFTQEGSFWINDISDIPEEVFAAEWNGYLRGKCAKEGYRSVALIPLRSGEEIIGLLQLNSFHKNAFSPDLIEFFESIGLIVGIALKRRRIEEEIRENEEKFRQLFNVESDSIFLIDNVNGEILEVNESAAALYGYDREELLQMKNTDLSAEPELTRQAMADKAVVIPIRYHRKKDGTVFPVEIAVSHLTRKGRTVHIAAIRDITVRMRIEAALRESEEKYRTLVENLNDVIYTLDTDGIITYISSGSYRLFHYLPEELIGRNFRDFIHPDDLQGVVTQFNATVAGDDTAYEYRVIDKNDNIHYVHSSVHPVMVNGRVTTLNGVLIDTTERRRIEEALRESEERLRIALEATHIGIWDWDLKNDIWKASPMYYTMLGYDPIEGPADRTEWLARVHPDDREQVESSINNVLSKKDSEYAYEARLRHADGTYRWIGVLGYVVEKDDAGTPERMLGIRMDITERKQAEDAIRESERFALSTVNALIANIAILDGTGEIVSVNRSWREFAHENGGDGADVFEGANYLAVCSAAAGIDAEGAAAFEAGIRDVMKGDADSYAQEYPCHSPRMQRWFVGRVTRFPGEGPVRIVVAHTEITERKLAEEKISDSLREKEVLLREIHHRVKNNMQVISSLLSLQSAYALKDADVKAALSETQDRIRAMALVHEKLYQTGDLSWIDFREYITSLASNVAQTFILDPDRIRLTMDIKSIKLGIDTAVPVGILLNELITNAFKYAFPGGRRGAITITMDVQDEEWYRLSIRDDGVGLPAGFNVEHTGSLGMRLVRILTQQIEGEMEIRSEKGTEFIITIPRKTEGAQ